MPAEWLVDPRTQPGVGYVAVVLVALVAATLATVSVAAALRRGGVPPRTLYARWFTWTVLAPIFALVCFSGPLAVAALMTVFALLGLREWSGLTALPRNHRLLLYAYAAVAGSLALYGSIALLATIPLLLIASTLQPILTADVRAGMRNLSFGALGFGYLPLLLGHGTLLARDIEGGGRLLFATGAAIAFSDIGAYVVGKSIGRRKLAPAISPNKTIEGTLGNLLGAIGGYLLFAPILPAIPLPLAVALPVVVAVGAVWGDLFKSVLKREFGVKDAGAWLPGFGGILDRIDSFILVVPLVYYAFLLAQAVR